MSQSHEHVHDPKEKKRQINRISRVIGHLQYVKRMLENDEDCSAVLMQIAATKSALNGLGKEIIKEHLTHCIAHAIEEGDTKAVEEFQTAIRNGIRKINYYTYMAKAGGKAVAEAENKMFFHDLELAAIAGMKEDVEKAMDIFVLK